MATLNFTIEADDDSARVFKGVAEAIEDVGDSAEEASRRGASAFEKFSTAAIGLNQGVELAKKGFGLLSTAITAPITGFQSLVEMSFSLVDAYDVHASALGQLELAMRNTGGATQNQLSTWEAWAFAVEESTTVAASELLKLAALGGPIVGFGDDLKRAIELAADVSAAADRGIGEAFRAVTRAVKSGSFELAGWGATALESTTEAGRLTEAIELMGRGFAGSAEAAANPIDRVRIAFKNLGIALGEVILKTPEFDAFITQLKDSVREFTSFVRDDSAGASKTFGAVFSAAFSLAALSATKMVGALKLVVGAVEFVKDSLDAIPGVDFASPLEDQAARVQAAFDDIIFQFQEEIGGKLFSRIESGINTTGTAAGEAFRLAFELGLDKARGFALSPEIDSAKLREQVSILEDTFSTLTSGESAFEFISEEDEKRVRAVIDELERMAGIKLRSELFGDLESNAESAMGTLTDMADLVLREIGKIDAAVEQSGLPKLENDTEDIDRAAGGAAGSLNNAAGAIQNVGNQAGPASVNLLEVEKALNAIAFADIDPSKSQHVLALADQMVTAIKEMGDTAQGAAFVRDVLAEIGTEFEELGSAQTDTLFSNLAKSVNAALEKAREAAENFKQLKDNASQVPDKVQTAVEVEVNAHMGRGGGGGVGRGGSGGGGAFDGLEQAGDSLSGAAEALAQVASAGAAAQEGLTSSAQDISAAVAMFVDSTGQLADAANSMDGAGKVMKDAAGILGTTATTAHDALAGAGNSLSNAAAELSAAARDFPTEVNCNCDDGTAPGRDPGGDPGRPPPGRGAGGSLEGSSGGPVSIQVTLGFGESIGDAIERALADRNIYRGGFQ